MKHLRLLALLCCLATFGCKTPSYSLGTTEAAFKAGSRGAKLVSMNKDMTVYLLSVHKAYSYEHIYYYFVDDKLVEINHGVPRPDVLIQTQ